MKKLPKLMLLVALCVTMAQSAYALKDTFTPYTEDNVAMSLDELWADFNPHKEPLDVEVIRQWEKDDVIMKIIRFRAYVHKGQKAMVAAVYGYPKDGIDLPGLVQLHGGGQYAHENAVYMNAKRGYATISVSWAGRIDATPYRVTPAVVQLFNEQKTDDPDYKLTTDWGAVDAYHAPFRNEEAGTSTSAFDPTPWTIDSVFSPRNQTFFSWTVAGRRAITFLEQQDIVDPDKIGVYGHSMGGRLTVLVAGSDPRVKVAVPSCGGPNFVHTEAERADAQFRHSENTMSNNIHNAHITCPILYLNPANDFNGFYDYMNETFETVKSEKYGVVASAHYTHQDNAESTASGMLWFDAYLKGNFEFPESPELKVRLDASGKVKLQAEVVPDECQEVQSVDVYYTVDGKNPEGVDERNNRKMRFWHFARATKVDGKWVASLPLGSVEKTLWVYAHVNYALDEPVEGANYYYRSYKAESFNVSSPMTIISSAELKAAKVKPTLKPSRVIEDFEGEYWDKDWFAYHPETWELKTHKIYSELWKASKGDKLVVELSSECANTMTVYIDGYTTDVELAGDNTVETFTFEVSDFKNKEGEILQSWDGIMELSFTANQALNSDEKADTKANPYVKWRGEMPTFKLVKWAK